ncbi:MAG: TonB-dependent receptor domain-containing protein [Desulfobacterales bacterium]
MRQRYFDRNVPIAEDGLVGKARNGLGEFDMAYDEEDSLAEAYVNNEDIYAGYLMGGISFNEMKVIGGARVEYTDFESQGYQVGDGISRVKADNSYTNVLPGLHYRWNVEEDLVLRASWTNTIARPTTEQSRNAIEIDDDDVERGNPDLDPYQSMNFDVSARYYLPSLGMIQIAGFYKDIEDFIFEQTIQGASPRGGDLTTYNNGKSGEIYGLELGYQQQFKFLPSPYDGFGFNTNLTLADSEATVPPTGDQPARDVPFLRQSDTIGNVSVFFEKYGFSFRVAGSYRDDYLDELGEVESEDRYMDDHFQVDLSTSYAVNENFTVYADAINLNEEPLRAYWDKSGALSQYEAYGRQIRAGVQWTF